VLEYNEKDDVRDRSYWADGRTRRFSADALGLWQSQCYLKGGATCLNCHTNVHDPEIEKAPQLRPASNAICTNCHREIARAVPAHTHHGEGSAGSSCVECHMPRTVFSIKAAIRDHSMSLPTPENTIRHKIPNACNEACHKNRDAGWAAARLKEWYGTGKRAKMVRRADAFSRARAGDTGAIEGLLAIQADAGESFPIRANAVGHLGRFSGDPRVMPVLLAAISARGPGSDPRIRAAAAMSVQGPGRAGAIADALKAGLSDPARTVRIAAALGLVNLGPSHLPLGDPAFTRAVAETRQQFEISADDADRQLEAGWFYLKSGDPARALNAVKITSRLDPQLPVRYLEGGALAMLGRMEEARRALQQVPCSDRWYREAQQMLGALAGR
jgi:hypothetical protein